jgi:integrase/recombinase XerD
MRKEERMSTVTMVCRQQHTAQLWLRVPQPWHDFLSAKAREEGGTRSELLRRAFRLVYGAELEQYESIRESLCDSYPDDIGPPGSNHRSPYPHRGEDPWLVAADDFVENKCSPATRRAYRRGLHQLLRFVAKHPARIRQGDVIAYRQHLETRKRSPSTIVQVLACVSGYYDLCAERGLTANNPARGVERPRVSAYTTATWLSLEQARLFLDLPARSTIRGKRDYAILITIAVTGMRRAELCSLMMRHVARSGGKVRFRYTAKGGGEVVREIPDRCWAAIEAYLDASGRHLTGESPLFAAVTAASKKLKAEKPLSTEAVRQMVAGYAQRAFGDDICVTPHSLRHTAATLLQADGWRLEEIQGFLRHKRAETTRRYLHVTEAGDARMGERLWEKLSG